MEQYPIQPSLSLGGVVQGEKLVTDDLNPGWQLAGTIDDYIRAELEGPPVSAGTSTGYAKCEVPGPIVIPDGSSDGNVTVQPFTAVMNGLTNRAMWSCYFAGQTIAVATPLPTNGNQRWDLLYAILSQADGSQDNRLFAASTTGVKSTQSVNTRHVPSVTLAWQQGTATSTGTDPYPAGSWPTLAAPPAGQVYVPLAYVQVQYSATPSTVQYSINSIAQCAPLIRLRETSGAEIEMIAPCVTDQTGAPVGAMSPTALITLVTKANGGFGTTPANSYRPPRFIEPCSGGVKLWIPLIFGTSTWTNSWTILSKPFAGPAVVNGDPASQAIGRASFLNRFFRSSLNFDVVGVNNAATAETAHWAHDPNVVSYKIFPTSVPAIAQSGGTNGPQQNWDGMNAGGNTTTSPPYPQLFAQLNSIGNSNARNMDFESLTSLATVTGGAHFAVAAIWRGIYFTQSWQPTGMNTLGSTINGAWAQGSNVVDECSLAVLCDSGGNLWLAGCQPGSGNHILNNRSGLIVLECSPQMSPYGAFT
jgi:hypothetical protein